MTDTYRAFKRWVLGRPLATFEQQQERLSKKLALPVFSADAISSTAYATEEILLALILAGSAALSFSVPVALAVAALLAMVALSYRQTVRAYPNGGGSYVVSRENLGFAPGLTAAASLMVGYVATVAVSASSGVAAITSAFPALYPYRTALCVALVVLVATANLRGVRESGRLFAVPTYAFMLLCGGLVVVGAFRWLTGSLEQMELAAVPPMQDLTVFLILRAFAGGCAAMTGTEAISNAVPAFAPPESKNAATTLAIMAAVLGFLLVGVTGLAQILGVVPETKDTVLSQVARSVYGDGGFLYFSLQIATMAILVLGANTCYAGFPRLSSVLARDGLMPRQFMNRGDRLVFSNGIVGLTIAAVLIIIIFDADTHRMIPFYALGVFIGFTLSQTGMVVHWRRLGTPGWRGRALMNAFGALLTGVVAVVILATKFVHGAYIVVVAVPVLVSLFYFVHHHYQDVGRALAPQPNPDSVGRFKHIANKNVSPVTVMLVAQVNELTVRSLAFARSLAGAELHAVTVASDPERLARLQRDWEALQVEVQLQAIDSPYRDLIVPVVTYLKSLEPSPKRPVLVVIPELVVPHWWQIALHNQDAMRLRAALRHLPWVSVLSVPFPFRAEEAKGIGERSATAV